MKKTLTLQSFLGAVLLVVAPAIHAMEKDKNKNEVDPSTTILEKPSLEKLSSLLIEVEVDKIAQPNTLQEKSLPLLLSPSSSTGLTKEDLDFLTHMDGTPALSNCVSMLKIDLQTLLQNCIEDRFANIVITSNKEKVLFLLKKLFWKNPAVPQGFSPLKLMEKLSKDFPVQLDKEASDNIKEFQLIAACVVTPSPKVTNKKEDQKFKDYPFLRGHAKNINLHMVFKNPHAKDPCYIIWGLRKTPEEISIRIHPKLSSYEKPESSPLKYPIEYRFEENAAIVNQFAVIGINDRPLMSLISSPSPMKPVSLGEIFKMLYSHPYKNFTISRIDAFDNPERLPYQYTLSSLTFNSISTINSEQKIEKLDLASLQENPEILSKYQTGGGKVYVLDHKNVFFEPDHPSNIRQARITFMGKDPLQEGTLQMVVDLDAIDLTQKTKT